LADSPKAIPPTHTRAMLAQTAHVSEHKIRLAEQVQKERPELLPQVAAGELRLAKAAQLTKRQADNFDCQGTANRIGRAIAEAFNKAPAHARRPFLALLRSVIDSLERKCSQQRPIDTSFSVMK
jgi:phage terminase Nu1 subunit (DNA packaging protein)